MSCQHRRFSAARLDVADPHSCGACALTYLARDLRYLINMVSLLPGY